MTPRVLVVGAGPAGSAAALALARAGAVVRLLDRASFPRSKLCGDTVNPGTLTILDRLGVGAAVRARARPVTGMVVTGPGGAAVRADYPHALHGAAIERRDLDALLLEAAIAAGAEFTPDVRVVAPLTADDGSRIAGVRIHRPGGEWTLHADVLIAADGRGSRIASAAGLSRFARTPRRWAFGAYFTGIAGLTSHGEMHIRDDRYIGIAPLTDELANVCVVKDVASGVSRKDVIADAIAADADLRERFAHAQRVSPVTSLGPLAVDASAAGCPGLLLAGDASGFVDPMTGDGLRFALRGGELAAEAALLELQTRKPSFRRLERAREREFSRKWRVNRALRSLVASPRGVAVAAAVGSRWPASIRFLVGVAGDIQLAGRTIECHL